MSSARNEVAEDFSSNPNYTRFRWTGDGPFAEDREVAIRWAWKSKPHPTWGPSVDELVEAKRVGDCLHDLTKVRISSYIYINLFLEFFSVD